jgi:hypothetical protein
MSQSGRLLMARIVPHKLACQLLSVADKPLRLFAQLVLLRVGAMLLTAFTHSYLPGTSSVIETTPCVRSSNLKTPDQADHSGNGLLLSQVLWLRAERTFI